MSERRDNPRDHVVETAEACAHSRAHLNELAANLAKTKARIEQWKAALAEQADTSGAGTSNVA